MDSFLWMVLIVDVFFLLLASVYLLLSRKRCPKKKMVNPWDPERKELHYDSYEDLIEAIEEQRRDKEE